MAHHPECKYDAESPCFACYPYRHAADGCPTSEPCPGINKCDDCKDVLAQAAQSLDPGVHHAATHDLIVASDGSFTALET